VALAAIGSAAARQRIVFWCQMNRLSNHISLFTSAAGESEFEQAYQAVLQKWPCPYSEVSIPTSYGDTYVIACGPESAKPIVLLHALFATATSWYGVAGRLSKQYRVYAIDVLGEANRSRPTRPFTSLDDFLQWFTEVIDGLELNELFLEGNSYGGFTAAYYAMHRSDRIRKLALIGPAATIHSMPSFYFNMFIPKMLSLAFPWLPGRDRVARHSMDWMRAGLPKDVEWERVFLTLLKHGKMISQVFPRKYSPIEFAKIAIPTLLILGDREMIYSVPRALESAKRLMPSIQTEVIPLTHHISAISQPELVASSLLRFFESTQ
jgi:pimeloyl-ACP methyl ester carboxylesterase